MGSLSEVFLVIFILVWIALGISGLFLFFLNNNAKFKKKYFPRYIILLGVLFSAFTLVAILVEGENFFTWLITLPVIALISLLNFRNTKFCDTCGKTNFSRVFFLQPRHCSNCGTELKDNELLL
jgi:hypothetical protein